MIAAFALAGGCGRIDFAAVGDGAPSQFVDGKVEAPQFVQQTATSSISAPATSVAFPGPITAGNTIVIHVSMWGSVTAVPPASSVTDTLGTTFASAVGQVSTPGDCGSESVGGEIFYAHVSATALDTITFTSGDTVSGLIAVEYGGLLVLDQVSMKLNGPMGPPMQTFDSGSTPATTEAGEIAISLGIPCAGAGGLVTWGANPGFTTRGVFDDAAEQPAMAADMPATSIGTYTDTWTITFLANPSVALGLIATFH